MELVGKLADGREKLTGIGAQMLSVVQEVAAERDTLRQEARLASSRAESDRSAALASMELQLREVLEQAKAQEEAALKA